MSAAARHVYGPVPSRRLGASLGVDLVPVKTCDYDCLYCQLGRTPSRTLTRRIAPYLPAETLMEELEERLHSGIRPDYITMAGSGEPTLNSELGKLLSMVRELTDVPVAVLTNGSLLSDPAVSSACLGADLVLPSLDAGDETTFREVNRPCAGVAFSEVVEGIARFRESYAGLLWLEVMLLDGINSDDRSVEKIAGLVERIRPDEVQLNTVVRPPAEPRARPVTGARLLEAAGAIGPRATVLEEAMRQYREASAVRVEEGELLELLGRRPCTRAHVADAFGINEIEALKLLSELMAHGTIVSESSGGKVFYRLLPPGE